MASDLGLHYVSMSHKKNARLLNTFVVYVTHISCIVSSLNWIMIGYRAVLTICGTETVTIKKGRAVPQW